MDNRKPYVSPRRSEPLLLLSRPRSGEPNGTVKKRRRGFDYAVAGNSLTATFRRMCATNRTIVAAQDAERLRLVREGIDLEYKIASHYVPLSLSVVRPTISEAYRVLFSCFHKNLVGLTTALILTEMGLYGPARPVLRHAFESLVTAKFCSLRPRDEVYDRWLDGKQIYIGNAVFKRLQRPTPSRLQELWGVLSNYTHSSIYALQPDLDVQSNAREVSLNLVFILMLLECNEHILLRHLVTSSVRYYLKRYAPRSDARSIGLQARLRQLLASGRRSMEAGARAVVRDFKTQWALTP